MRILFTIPHVFNPQPEGKDHYGSLSQNPQPRIAALTQALCALRSLDESSQFWFEYTDKLYMHQANQGNFVQLDIIICTTQGLHVLDQLPKACTAYRHHPTDCEPMFLGFECHALLKSHLGQYDYYCYLEDDLILHDPQFFLKIAWFNACVGDRAVLQPNRYEQVSSNAIKKVYIDPARDCASGRIAGYAHNFHDNLTISGQVMGRPIQFIRAGNPHSGCFFLNARQMEHWANSDYFLNRDTRFFGPLESAASLGLMQTFRVYKPAPTHANFLEIQHFGEAWSHKLPQVILQYRR
ncbi:calcium-binding protein [Desertifilum sp. FACHB-1129]|uniref:Calcium-binding protein n=2 Tax=Desertifilum tharense IPPAS B-1220 TaxID=1781255 RepID=A0A1E5QPX8_9CYAN|nr:MULTISPECIES: hypothetical protein [Desertifilum]MDA0209891.1 calcium-binding protein [Cyanobacteria bacterium FC1]MBD2310619.1 calcium-binding protein [Desertifilum sp. FACHB-1129]MBD2320656.1 calcium-binding protein [Desertifilum sp. FACHB-866]MBD2330784.1 calcium-binding protein [Desertifilum sp. FACHB-868]OEJ76664.1 hypothetical protein BH720_03680 [Desertifilum tharense IPPAS B-1220]